MAKSKKTRSPGKPKAKGASRQAAKKVVKLKARKPAGKNGAKHAAKNGSRNGIKNGNGLPRPSTKPYGQAGKALDGLRILDFTHVQSGPTCTQLLAWFGADVIKVERPGLRAVTRGPLRDVKGADSLYFTMLNGNKRSITIDSKHAKGKEILARLIKHCDVLVENF